MARKKGAGVKAVQWPRKKNRFLTANPPKRLGKGR